MALPKRQHSKQRGRKRRTSQKTVIPSLGKCPNCSKPIISHRVCPFCGHYKGNPVVKIEVKEKKKKQ